MVWFLDPALYCIGTDQLGNINFFIRTYDRELVTSKAESIRSGTWYAPMIAGKAAVSTTSSFDTMVEAIAFKALRQCVDSNKFSWASNLVAASTRMIIVAVTSRRTWSAILGTRSLTRPRAPIFTYSKTLRVVKRGYIIWHTFKFSELNKDGTVWTKSAAGISVRTFPSVFWAVAPTVPDLFAVVSSTLARAIRPETREPNNVFAELSKCTNVSGCIPWPISVISACDRFT